MEVDLIQHLGTLAGDDFFLAVLGLQKHQIDDFIPLCIPKTEHKKILKYGLVNDSEYFPSLTLANNSVKGYKKVR